MNDNEQVFDIVRQQDCWILIWLELPVFSFSHVASVLDLDLVDIPLLSPISILPHV